MIFIENPLNDKDESEVNGQDQLAGKFCLLPAVINSLSLPVVSSAFSFTWPHTDKVIFTQFIEALQLHRKSPSNYIWQCEGRADG